MGELEINQFLTYLAVEKQMASSTQNLALCAILIVDEGPVKINPKKIPNNKMVHIKVIIAPVWGVIVCLGGLWNREGLTTFSSIISHFDFLVFFLFPISKSILE